MLKFLSSLLPFLIAAEAFAGPAPALLPSDTVRFGKYASSDKTIQFSNGSATPPAIKLNSSTGQLQYTNDGTNFRNIGSGSGGSGINYLTPSPDAESGLTGWTAFNGTVTATISIATPGVITTSAAHGLSLGSQVAFTTTGALPTGLAVDTIYYVSAVPSTTTFRLSATLGGADINTSGTQSGTHTLRPITPPALAAFGTSTSGAAITWTVSSSAPLRGSNSFVWTKGASDQAGHGVSTDFTIDSQDQAKIENITFEYALTSATGTYSSPFSGNSDIQVWVYDKTNNLLIQPTPYTVQIGTNGQSFKYQAAFQTASNSTSYRLILLESTTAATAYTLKLDNFQVGPNAIAVAGSPITDWQQYTLNIQADTANPTKGGTIVYDKAFWRRIGDSMEILYTYKQSVAGSAGTGNYLFPIPSGYTIDSNKSHPTTNYVTEATNVGTFYTTISGTSGSGVMFIYDTTRLAPRVYRDGTPAFQTISATQFPLSDAATFYTFHAVVPIVGWASQTTMSQDSDTRVLMSAITKATNQSIANNTATLITWDSLTTSNTDFDPNGSFSGSPIDRYIVQVPGYYEACSDLILGTVAGPLGVYIRVNGISASATAMMSSASSVGPSAIGCRPFKLNAGDYLQVYGYQNTGGAANINSGSIFYVKRASGPSVISASEGVSFRASSSVATSLSNGVQTTLPFVKEWDSHLAWTGSTYVCPMAGKYSVSVNVQTQSAAWTAGTDIELYLVKNGSISSVIGAGMVPAAVTVPQTAAGSVDVSCLQGDILRIDAYQNSGSAKSLVTSTNWNWVNIKRVGN